LADNIIAQYPEVYIDTGGSGYDLNKLLPDHIENLKPDYSLYPEFDYSIDFSSRGRSLKCHFCIVHEKEGMFKRTQFPRERYNQAFTKIVFLDNNIFADKQYFMKITE
jgi:hypothetical protein